MSTDNRTCFHSTSGVLSLLCPNRPHSKASGCGFTERCPITGAAHIVWHQSAYVLCTHVNYGVAPVWPKYTLAVPATVCFALPLSKSAVSRRASCPPAPFTSFWGICVCVRTESTQGDIHVIFLHP